jgi:excisionase family DNA binding protein
MHPYTPRRTSVDPDTHRRVSPSTRLLTVPEALLVLRIGRSTFYKLAGRGEIRTLRLGARTLVPEREIERLINSAVDGDVA